MDANSKLTKEVVSQEARFILDSLMAAGQYDKEVPLDELRRLCEQSVSLRLQDYVSFLERFGYVTFDRNTHRVVITSDGERVVGGDKVAELVIDVVHHFRPVLSRGRAREEAPAKTTRRGGVRSRGKGGAARDVIDGRYERLRAVGSGGIGTVYQARQIQLDREVAVKEIRELFGFFTEPQRQEIVRRFDEEVRKAARLAHPNITGVIDGNTAADFPYVVTDFVGGGDLRRIIKHAKAIPPDLAVKVFLQILHALRHAQLHDVVHRGLKPENILFDLSGNVKVTDFGLSRVVERDQAVIQHVYVGMGSVAYMAPELFSDPRKVTLQTDLYALGILLYEMLGRKLPGRRSPMPTKLHPGLPKVIDDIFDRLTQDEPSDRYETVDQVLDDFHSTDATRALQESRGAVIFLDNPLDQLELEPPAEEAAAEEPEESATNPAAAAMAAATAAAGAAESPAASAATAAPEPPADELAAGAAGGVASTAVELTDEAAMPPPPASTRRVPSSEMAPVGGDAEEEEEGGAENGLQKRRSRVRRPYSFQQRLKDRGDQ